jgi:hypothetical protein
MFGRALQVLNEHRVELEAVWNYAEADRQQLKAGLSEPIPRWMSAEEQAFLAARRAVARLRLAGWCT